MLLCNTKNGLAIVWVIKASTNFKTNNELAFY